MKLVLPFLVVAFPLALGCGGSTYSLGNLPPDGGGDAVSGSLAPGQTSTGGNDAGPNGFCFTTGDGGGCDAGFGSSGGGFASPDSGNGVTTEDASVGTTNGCVVSSVTCPAGTTAYTCGGGDYPTEAQPDLSCADGPMNSGFDSNYCCFPWPGNGACTPYPDFPCDGNSFGYQCSPGTAPSQVVSSLSCGSPFPDSNGDSDFCCLYH
jgi:hypothetical protein